MCNAVATAAEETAIHDRRGTRPRRSRMQPGVGVTGGSVKRFPQFPPGATAAAAKAARPGDATDRRDVLLPMLSSNASTITSPLNSVLITPRSDVSERQLIPHEGGMYHDNCTMYNLFLK